MGVRCLSGGIVGPVVLDSLRTHASICYLAFFEGKCQWLGGGSGIVLRHWVVRCVA